MTSASAVVTASTPLWYSTRATGVVALVLLTGSVVLGVVISVRYASERWPRFVTIGVHRNLSLLVLVFLALHIITAVADPYAPVGWLAVVIPFISAYRPIWLGLGTVASDILIALVVTSLLRTRVGHRVWRLVHWTAYACWPLAMVHTLGSGSDMKAPVILAVTVACAAAVAAALLWRLAAGWPSFLGVRLAAGLTGAVTAIAVAGWALGGPLKPGWAARAGTPAALIARANKVAASSASTLKLPLNTAITGTTSVSTANSGLTTVTIDGTGSSAAFHVVLSGPAAPDGGVSMTGSDVTFGPTGQPTRYHGQITGLSGTNIQASLTDSAGAAVTLTLDLTINGTAVTGTLAAVSRTSR